MYVVYWLVQGLEQILCVYIFCIIVDIACPRPRWAGQSEQGLTRISAKILSKYYHFILVLSQTMDVQEIKSHANIMLSQCM